MVLKRKLPSQLAKEKAAPAAQASAPENSAPADAFITDFQAEPAPQSSTPKPKKEADAPAVPAPSDETDQFTADALKEAADALAAEMSAPSSDLPDVIDPFGDLDMEDIAPAAKSEKPKKAEAPKEPVPEPEPDVAEAMELNAPLKDTFAGVDDGPNQTSQAEPALKAETKEDAAMSAVSDAVSDIDGKPEKAKEAEKPASQEPSKPEEPKEVEKAKPVAGAPDLPKGLKRKNRNKRKRAAAATGAQQASSSQSDAQQQTYRPSKSAMSASSAEEEKYRKRAQEATSSKPQDMELSAHYKPREDVTKASVDRAFTEMAGVPDPAKQEIEAAYVPPAEVEPESVTNAPKPDVSKLLDAVGNDEKEPLKEDVREPQAQPAPESAPQPTAPVSFADEMAQEPDSTPKVDRQPEPVEPKQPKEEPAAKDQTEAKADSQPVEGQEDKAAKGMSSLLSPAMPTVAFETPQSFADMAQEAKSSAALPWEEEAQSAEKETESELWEFDAPAPSQDIYASGSAPADQEGGGKEESAPADAQTDAPAKQKKSALSLPFLSKAHQNGAADEVPLPAPSQSKTSGDLPPPELPQSIPAKEKSSFNARPLLVLLALGVVGFAGYKIFTNQDEAQDRVARFTGALDQTPETLPAQQSAATPSSGNAVPSVGSIQPEKIVTADELALLNQELEEDLARLNESGNPLLDPPEPTAKIDFVDVTAEEANKPIVADKDEALPGEKGFVASLQDAINQEREKRGLVPQSETESNSEDAVAPEERRMESADLQAQVQAELEAYRKALAGTQDDMSIKPNDFFGTVDERGVLLPPKQRMPAGAKGLPESEIYTENPYNLPVLAEPESDPVSTVRSLDDFDVAMFEPPKPKVRIPQGLKPRLRASDFPEMTALSFIPNKGMIGYANGREGVLLIGEMIEGWELYAVTANHAEFRSGQRKYYVNIE